MKKLSFNKDWTVRKDGENSLISVSLPHDAMLRENRKKDNKTAGAGAYFGEGKYIYEKRFSVPEEWKDRKLIMECEGVYQNAVVMINGSEACAWPYGYTNFFVDLGKYLNNSKENLIQIIADNSQIPNSRWYSGSGVYREVSLYIGNKNYIYPDGIQIKTIDQSTIQVITKIEGQGNTEVTILDGENEIAKSIGTDMLISIADAKLWSENHPFLYTCKVKLVQDGVIYDEMTQTFGMRVLEWKNEGFIVNGNVTLLRGACIHHDNGVLGACAFRDAEFRRIRILKESGFNAIRSAHNPISKAMLEACDTYGMYVMDETFDYWLIHKKPYDYADKKFKEWWKNDVESMVKKDYNHPSVVMYSIGNEISELGIKEGQNLCRQIADFVRSIDDSRAITCGINLMLASMTAKGGGLYGNKKGKENTNGSMSMDSAPTSTLYNVLMNKMGSVIDKMAARPAADKVVEAISPYLDICGYNYATSRYDKEQKQHPERLIVGSETLPKSLYKNWQFVMKNPALIGDFMWTGWDYLGETGLGIIRYQDRKRKENSDKGLMILSGCGVIDICGKKRPEVHWNKAIWGLQDKPAIGVDPINHRKDKKAASMWRDTDAVESWSWEGYEGEKTNVVVYSNADAVVLDINGKRIGKKRVEECKALFKNVIYQPGTIRAIGYDKNGIEVSRNSLMSANGNTSIMLHADRKSMKANGQDLCFIDIELVGENGITKSAVDQKLKVTVTGNGTLQGLGSARPNTEESYISNIYKTYYGKLLAVVRAGYESGEIRVLVTGTGLNTIEYRIECTKE